MNHRSYHWYINYIKFNCLIRDSNFIYSLELLMAILSNLNTSDIIRLSATIPFTELYSLSYFRVSYLYNYLCVCYASLNF